MRANKVHIFRAGLVKIGNCEFSHRRSCPPDRNALRNPLRNMHQNVIKRNNNHYGQTKLRGTEKT